MGKWYAGVVTISIALVLILISMFTSWYYVTEEGVNVGLVPPGSPGPNNQTGLEHDNKSHTMKTEYSLLSGERTTSIAAYFDTNGDGRGDSSTSKSYDIQAPASAENYAIPLGGPIEDGGQPAVLDVYNTVYLFYLIAMITIGAAIALIALAGLGFIPKFVPKIPIGVAIALAALAPFYFVFFQPMAFDEDSQARYDYQVSVLREVDPDAAANISDYQTPSQAEFFMGTVYSKDESYNQYDIKTSWGPGLGWFFAIGALVFTIIAIGNTHPTRVRRQKKEKAPKPKKEAVETAPQAYQCPTCGQPLLFMKNAQAYYCNICQTYVNVPGFPAPVADDADMDTDLGLDDDFDAEADDLDDDSLEW